MNREIMSTLHIDIQDSPPADFCPICGGERYWPGPCCVRCEEGLL